jgi:hypothetical protein
LVELVIKVVATEKVESHKVKTDFFLHYFQIKFSI